MRFLEKIFSYDNHQKYIDDAEWLYQLKESGGEIWLTYNGFLVCPCSMLNADPVDAIKRMRELYVKRNETKQ